VGFFSGTFFAALERFAFLYRAAKNVVNLSRYAKFLHKNRRMPGPPGDGRGKYIKII
jgi:hypothetical protein